MQLSSFQKGSKPEIMLSYIYLERTSRANMEYMYRPGIWFFSFLQVRIFSGMDKVFPEQKSHDWVIQCEMSLPNDILSNMVNPPHYINEADV